MSYCAKKCWFTFVTVAQLWCVHAGGQQYLHRAKVTHLGDELIVSASDGRPLEAAVEVLAEEFGWIVDYEDPIYSNEESVDVTAPAWRRTHPTERGAFDPSGGKFDANLGKVDKSDDRKGELLENLVDQYNRSNNPGYFRLIHTHDGRFVISGRSRTDQGFSQEEVLDRVIEPGQKRLVVGDAIQHLLSQCSQGDSVSMIIGTVPNNAIAQSSVDGYTGKISCRDQLGRILSALPYALDYFLLYDISTKTYALNITPAHQLITGSDGIPTLVPLHKPTSKESSAHN